MPSLRHDASVGFIPLPCCSQCYRHCAYVSDCSSSSSSNNYSCRRHRPRNPSNPEGYFDIEDCDIGGPVSITGFGRHLWHQCYKAIAGCLRFTSSQKLGCLSKCLLFAFITIWSVDGPCCFGNAQGLSEDESNTSTIIGFCFLSDTHAGASTSNHRGSRHFAWRFLCLWCSNWRCVSVWVAFREWTSPGQAVASSGGFRLHLPCQVVTEPQKSFLAVARPRERQRSSASGPPQRSCEPGVRPFPHLRCCCCCYCSKPAW
mmetsp:Transcript_61598/g.134717  ORF Transcript_61598/g.134717 Transcript_61598/m.134717 type:complete len:259 (+) Transcript_61598:1534-2310(+)